MFTENVDFHLDGFIFIRFDRDVVRTRKSIGRGLCWAFNCKLATNITVRETEWCKHYELMAASFRPHYLPQEFGQITVILAYVPGPEFNLAAERFADSYNRVLTQTGDQPVFLLGDFNKCDITTHLPNFKKYVTIPTRMQSTLDLCFGNITSAYVSKPHPPLGLSEVILLLPKYWSKLKREEPISKSKSISPSKSGTTSS